MLCAAIVCDNTPRSIARIAQARYALHATAISLRSIRLRHALLPRSGNTRICARLSPRWGNTTLCAAIVCDNTPRSIARIAQARYALYATAISLRSIRLRHALLPMRAIRAFVHGYFAALNTPCQLRYALNRLFALNPKPYELFLPSHRLHISPTYSACAENLPAPTTNFENC